jgi:hypothetical protein
VLARKQGVITRRVLSQLFCFGAAPETICSNETDYLLGSTCNGVDTTHPPPISKSPTYYIETNHIMYLSVFVIKTWIIAPFDLNQPNKFVEMYLHAFLIVNVDLEMKHAKLVQTVGTSCFNDSLSWSNGGFCNGINDACIIVFAKPSSGTICLNATDCPRAADCPCRRQGQSSRSEDCQAKPASWDCYQVFTCDGINFICPLTNPIINGITCRNAMGLGDIPEHCNGINIAYPTDIFLLNGTICRPNNDGCFVTISFSFRENDAGEARVSSEQSSDDGRFATTSWLCHDVGFAHTSDGCKAITSWRQSRHDSFNKPHVCDETGPFCPISNLRRDFAYSIKYEKITYFYGIETIGEITFKNI